MPTPLLSAPALISWSWEILSVRRRDEVDPRGFEPLISSMPWKRDSRYAAGPHFEFPYIIISTPQNHLTLMLISDTIIIMSKKMELAKSILRENTKGLILSLLWLVLL